MSSSTHSLPVVRTVAALRSQVAAWRAAGLKIALVPTMGALHEGHLSLVGKGLSLADRVIVTLFVNPKQFGPTEDLARYPRQEETDAAMLASAGAHLLYAPDVGVMYPAGFVTTVHVDDVSQGLCGAVRPVFFDGVATVVTKLFLQALPDYAIFGEKDYQQLQVIRTMTRDLDIPLEVVGAPTIREADGLAMSSRNAYLTPAERQAAPVLYQTLNTIAAAINRGEEIASQIKKGSDALIQAGFSSVDYLEVRDAETLKPVETATVRPMRLFVAAWLGKARLIDNIAV